MKVRAYIHFALVTIIALLLLPVFSFAQTNVGGAAKDLVSGVIKEKFDKETGLDQIPDIEGINAGSIADDLVKGIIGDIPSPTMGQLTREVRKLFRVYTTSKKYSVCERAANSRAWSSLRQIEEKAHFAPWADIAWTAIKSIASGGKTIGELIKENTKAELKKLLKDAIDSSPPPPEIKSLTFSGNCDTTSVTKWDPATKKITIIVTGDCGCVRQVVGLSRPKLSKFEVRIEGTVESRVRLRQSPLWWLDPQPQIQYFIKKIRVITAADCDSCRLKDGSEPPKEKGFITGVIEWFEGLFDSPAEPEDMVDPPKEEDETKSEEDSDFIGRITDMFVQMFNKDSSGDSTENEIDSSKGESDAGDSTENIGSVALPDVSETVEIEPLQCGDDIAINGRTNVPTYPLVITNNGAFSCNNTCGFNQLCHSVADQNIVSGSCTYCKNVCKEGQFRHEFDCNANKGANQQCIVAGSRSGGRCYVRVDMVEKEIEKDNVSSQKLCVIPEDDLNQAYPTDVFEWDKKVSENKTTITFTRDSACVSKSIDSVRRGAEVWLVGFKESCPTAEISTISYTNSNSPCSTTFTY